MGQPCDSEEKENHCSSVTSASQENFKFGHHIPVSVNEACALDRLFNTTRRRDAIAKEMRNVRIAFKILEDNENLSSAHEFVPYHLVFDVKMDDTFKTHFVAALFGDSFFTKLMDKVWS